MTRFVLLLTILLAASSAKAQTSNLTGNWLYSVCGASDNEGRVICQMWISGFQARYYFFAETCTGQQAKTRQLYS